MTTRWLFIYCMKFIRIIREKNRHVHITCTFSFHFFNWVVGWIPLLSHWRIHQVLYLFHQGWTLPSCGASPTSYPESRDSTIVSLLNFCGIILQKVCPTMHYAQLNIQYKKLYRCSTKTCPIGSAKNMFLLNFYPEHTKARELVNAQVC